MSGVKAISSTSKQGKKAFSSGDTVASYSQIEKGIYLNNKVLKDSNSVLGYNKTSRESWETVMNNFDKLSPQQKEIVERYSKAGRSLVGDGSVYDYTIHEIGHFVQWNILDTDMNNYLGTSESFGKFAVKISGYASSTKGEYIAESFVAYVKGEYSIIDPKFKKISDELRK